MRKKLKTTEGMIFPLYGGSMDSQILLNRLLKETASQLDHEGDPTQSFIGISTPDECKEAHLVFTAKPNQIDHASKSLASILVLPSKLKGQWQRPPHQSWLFTPDLKLTMAQILAWFDDHRPRTERPQQVAPSANIDPTAIIGQGCQIGENVQIGAYAVLEDSITLEEGTHLGAFCSVGVNSIVGAHSHIQSHVSLGPRTRMGNYCVVHEGAKIGTSGFGFAKDASGHVPIRQIGGTLIEDRVEIGPQSNVNRGTIGDTLIAAGTKLDSFCHIAHNCQIGRNCLIASGLTMGGSSSIGDHFVGGGRITLTDHAHIGPNVHMAGMSVVTKNVTEPGAYGGHPLQKLPNYLKTMASLPHLPHVRSQLKNQFQLSGTVI